MTVEWNFFDRKLPSRVSKRYLPHLDMSGALTFVTFRLADSMPRVVVQSWRDEIEAWLEQNGFAGKSAEAVLETTDIEDRQKQELRRLKQRSWNGHLDDCHGACVLRNAAMRKLVEQSLLYFEGQRYDLERFVVMPNHMHVLIQMREGFDLRKELNSLLRYTAREVNKEIGRKGELWQAEPFDHIVRSESQFEYLQQYIIDNPKKANLPESDYTLWLRK